MAHLNDDRPPPAHLTPKERLLSELQPVKRPRYFEGELLSAQDFQDEQDYVRHKSQLHNRLGLGAGVVCGLSVTEITTSQGSGVRVSAGLALDAWGCEIVVPADVDVVPLRLMDDCNPSASSDRQLPSSVHIVVCYREQVVDESPGQTPYEQAGPDVAGARRVLESYCLRVTVGTAPNVATNADTLLAELLSAGRWHDALCHLSATTCPLPTDDPGVVLANVTVGQDGSLTIDACGPRSIVPTNRLLTQLVSLVDQAGQ